MKISQREARRLKRREPERLLSIAAALREQIPLVSSDAARPMIDAAELLKERATNCDCPVCTAERERLAAESTSTKQSLN